MSTGLLLSSLGEISQTLKDMGLNSVFVLTLHMSGLGVDSLETPVTVMLIEEERRWGARGGSAKEEETGHIRAEQGRPAAPLWPAVA